MKKLPVAAILFSFILMLAACNSQRQAASESGAQPDQALHPGDTVSTDLFEFTLDYAQLAYSLHGESVEDRQLICRPKEYDPISDNDIKYVAHVGTTLVSLQYTITNLNRVDYPFAKPADLAERPHVIYKDKEYLASYRDCFFSNEGDSEWSPVSLAARLHPQQSLSFRTVASIPVDVKELKDSFEISFILLTSSGEKKEFTYLVTEADLSEYQSDQ